MYPHQADRLTAALEAAGVEALVATSPANVAYVTGFRSAAPSFRPGEVFGVFTRHGTALVLPAREAAAALSGNVEVEHLVCHGRPGWEYAPNAGELGDRLRALVERAPATAIDALVSALETLDLRQRGVGLDESGLDVGASRRLDERLAGRVARGADALAGARMVKGPYEIECLQRALWVSEEAVNAVVQMLKPGVTEREASTLYQGEVVKRGGLPYRTVITMGELSALPTASPSDRALRRGDLVRFDVGCALKGYCSDLARVAAMGEPDSRQADVHAALQAAEEAAIAAIKPGATAGTILGVAVESLGSGVLPEYHPEHVGHGIGLESSEPPSLRAADATALEQGMVLCVEASYFAIGWAGLTLRDTVLVARGGARAANRSNRGLIVLD
jgi:Xaa-Pro dipeptidase